MEMLSVPEESLGALDDLSSCSSISEEHDATREQPEVTKEGLPASSGAAKVTLWRNLFLGCLVVTAVVLSVVFYVTLSSEEPSDMLPVVFMVVILVVFAGVGVLFVCYDSAVRNTLGHYQDPSSSDEYGVSASKKRTVYAMSSNGSVSGTSNTGSEHIRKVSSLLKGGFRSLRNNNNKATGSNNTTNTEQMSALASTESIANFLGAVRRETSFLSDDNVGTVYQTKPSAEFFAETTVLFADIAGFTAWSSVREPSQVFTLLETLFHAFDSIATRRNVFKVETVGDCYVAVTGLPEPTKQHAVMMARFARDCLRKMGPLCQKLETQLGPDTGDLNLRIGLHSGAVTGGVLRGKRSRFQLFGDTVNTAARMESTGEGGQIHLSDSTAKLLKEAGKSDWLTQRENQVMAKGKGNMTTFWLHVDESNTDLSFNASSAFLSMDEDDEGETPSPAPTASTFGAGQGFIDAVNNSSQALAAAQITNAKVERLVSWNVDLLHRLLKQIVARRQILTRRDPKRKADADESIYAYTAREDTLLEEVKESIDMPSESLGQEAIEHAKTIHLHPSVYPQLQDYVRTVASMYNNHPFHNFEHASHVTMSVAKLLSRIVAPSANEIKASGGEGQTLSDHTYGITSDPLTQFACVLSALIHDADHPGVPNTQLVSEETPEAAKYKGKSVAEQNSIDKCWELLMETKYDVLRRHIYTTSRGLARFRSLLVNSVMATDICDKDLKALRNARWDKAFNKDGEDPQQPESKKAAQDRKATIVIEHLIQASDVSHTMQHWHVYRRWNERLFRECHKAYTEGRAAKDPSECWYEGEKGFFDFYIIPLAKKLKECGVFGVSSSEYLDYAQNNRKEWEEKGKSVVEEMIVKVKMIERQQERKRKAEAEKLEAAIRENHETDSCPSMGSSGLMSFDSSASLGHLGPLE